MTLFSSPFPDISIPSTISLPDFITEKFSSYPKDRKLLVDPFSKRAFNCDQVLDLICKIAAGFSKKGLKLGDVVGVLLPNVIEYPCILHGIQDLGAIPTTLNPMSTAEEVAIQIKDSQAIFLITVPQLMDKVNAIFPQIGKQVREVFVLGDAPGASSFSSLITNDGKYARPSFDPNTTIAALPYSSGTTGVMKGVQLTHTNLVANILQTIKLHEGLYDDYSTFVGFLPFFHIYAMTVVLAVGLREGFTLVVMPRFDLHSYLQIIHDYKATALHVVPPVVVLLTKENTKHIDLSSVRTMVCGAAPLGAETENALKEKIPNVTVVQAYGMTEMSPVTHSNTAKSQLVGSVGLTAPNVQCKIVDHETGKELGVGQPGELWVKGPNRMIGYLNNQKATAHTIDKDGWLHTGDIGYFDAESNLFIVDRLKELIKYKAFQVAPAELETYLLTHPDIADVAVIGRPNLEAGELPMAFVVLKKDHKVSEKDIIAWIEAKVAQHKRLRGGVVFVDVIPKSASGKILRRLLRAKL